MCESPFSQHDVLEEDDIQKRGDELLETSKELLDEENLSTLRLILNNQHTSDLADDTTEQVEDLLPYDEDKRFIGTLLSGGAIEYFATPLGRIITLMLFVLVMCLAIVLSAALGTMTPYSSTKSVSIPLSSPVL